MAAERQRSRAAEAVRMTLTIVGNAVKAILSNETKVRVRERGSRGIWRERNQKKKNAGKRCQQIERERVSE